MTDQEYVDAKESQMLGAMIPVKEILMSERLENIRQWQVEKMGNTCTICHGRNANVKCEACGWWGRVPPLEHLPGRCIEKS